MTFQDPDNHSSRFHYYSGITMVSRESGVVPHSLLLGFEFTVILLDWLTPICYLTYSWGETWIRAFPKVIGVKVNSTSSTGI